MAVAFMLPIGKVFKSDPVPGRTCREHVAEQRLEWAGGDGLGLLTELWDVLYLSRCIDDEPIESYEGAKSFVVRR